MVQSHGNKAITFLAAWLFDLRHTTAAKFREMKAIRDTVGLLMNDYFFS
jgi:hypothetical protein